MTTRYLALALSAGLFLTACKDQDPAATNAAATTATDHADTKLPEPTSRLDAAATAELVRVRDAYLVLKDGLVKTDAAATDAAASRLLADAEILRHRLRKDTTDLAKSLVVQMDSIMQHCESIVALTNDSRLIKKRALFEPLSDNMYHLIQEAGLKQGPLYRQYCPMALNNTGGYWLSTEAEIRNPYYGDKMLECGEVTDSL